MSSIKKQIPNILTILRVALVPCLLLVVFTHKPPASAFSFILFCLIALTDFLDGYLARRWQVVTEFGAFLDPAADKILVIMLLVALVGDQASIYFTVPALLIIFRELFMSMLREYLARIAMTSILAVDSLGKFKTACQMLTLSLFLFPVAHPLCITMAYVFLYLTALLTLVSLGKYLSKLWQCRTMPAFNN